MEGLTTPETVQLYIYDLSKGLASSLSSMLLGKHIEGIWHTSIVIFGKEYYFGQTGISVCEPGSTTAGKPNEILKLGETHVSEELFDEYLNGLRQSRFSNGTYDLFKHNCNTFTNELSQFLTGEGIPQDILSLPDEILRSASSWLGHVQSFRGVSPDFETLNNDIDAVRQRSAVLDQKRNKIKEKVERLERRRKKKKKHDKNNSEYDYFNDLERLSPEYSQSTINSTRSIRRYKMAENAQAEVIQNGNSKSPSDIAAEMEEQERKDREEKRRHREPPIVFPNSINVQDEFDKVIGLVDGNVPAAEMQFFEELHQYMLEDEGSWAIGDGFLCFIGKLLNDNQKFPEELRVRLLKLLAVAALKEDVILVLHQDRREHVFMNYANNFDRLSIEEQKSLALFVCNLFENPSSSEWLLYISEWETNSGNTSNIRVTTRIAANSILSENADLQNYGTAIVHNLACKEVKSVVFDDVAVELTMAVLQFFNSKPSEEHVFRCMKALAKFIEVSQQDVSQLIQMIGPQPDKFKGLSERVDSFVTTIMGKLR